MNYTITKEMIALLEQFDDQNVNGLYTADMNGFKKWIYDNEDSVNHVTEEPYWEGKENGRSPESAISTMILHLSKYAKTYSKSAISDSKFTTQDDFIYLITLRSFGSMTKMDLINRNIHTKSAGTVIIARLIKNKWISIIDSHKDKRNKYVSITDQGLNCLDLHMSKIRDATQIVAGDLTYTEKMDLIRILNKLDRFHFHIFSRNIKSTQLIGTVLKDYPMTK